MTDIPPDFAAAIKQAGLTAFFAGCTPSHKNEYLKWISEAKRPETRTKRIAQAVGFVAAKCAKEKARAQKKAAR